MISSQNYLAKKYSWYEKCIFLLQALFIAIYSNQKGSVGLWMIFFSIILELIYIILKRPYFSKHVEGIIIWINVYLALLYLSAIWLRNQVDIGPSLFFILFAILVPISLRITRVISRMHIQIVQLSFEKLMNSNSLSIEDNRSSYIDEILRMIVYPDKVFVSSQSSQYLNIVQNFMPKEQGEKYREMLKTNLLKTFQMKLIHEINLELQALKRKKNQVQQMGSKSKQTKVMKQSIYSQDGGSNYDEAAAAERQIDAFQEAQQEIQRQQYSLDEKQIDGKIYIDKIQVYGDDEIMKENLSMYFHRVIQNSKDRTYFGDIDILHLVYILEVLQNEKLFDLKFHQMKKKLSFKQLQILKSLEQRSLIQKKLHVKEFNKESVYHSEYHEALSYDNMIQSLQHWIDETIEKKLNVLCMMRQRHIVISKLKDMLEDVQFRRKQIVKTISHLVQLNDKNSQLHALYICYLENLSFTDKDININKFKKIQQQNVEQRNYLANLDRSDACLIFTSLTKQNKGMIIKRITKNFELIFNYKSSEILNQPIEKLLPHPYQRHHQKFVKNFFNDSAQDEKGSVPLGFALTQQGYILPVTIGIRLTNFQGEFGLSAFVQVLDKNAVNYDPSSTYYNYQSKEYIIYDESNLKVVSMTLPIHALLFSRFKSMHQIFLRGFFPFLRKIFQNNSLRSSHTQRSGGKSSNTLLQSSRYMNSNRSISSNRRKLGKKDQPDKTNSKKQEKGKTKKDKENKKQNNNSDNGSRKSSLRKTATENLQTIQFLMIIQKSDNLKTDDQHPQFIEENFQFFTMVIHLCEKRLGNEGYQLTYLEITNIQEINAFTSSAFLLNAFDDQLDVLSNKSFFTQLVNTRIMEHLERFYLFQSLVQSGEIDFSKYNLNANEFNAKKSQNLNMTSKYKNNQLYKFYTTQGHKLLPEIINEIEDDEKYLENAKSMENKGGLNQWEKKHNIAGQNSNLEFAKQKSDNIEQSLKQYFDCDDTAQASRGKYYKQSSKDQNLRKQSIMENAKLNGDEKLEYAKKNHFQNQVIEFLIYETKLLIFKFYYLEGEEKLRINQFYFVDFIRKIFFV